MSRPRAISGETEKRLLEALEVGCPVSVACGYANIGRRTFYDALERDDSKLVEKVERARAEGAMRHLRALQDAAEEDWRAAAKWLEVCHPESFGRRRVEVSGPEGGPIKTAAEEIDPAVIAGALAALAESGGHPLLEEEAA